MATYLQILNIIKDTALAQPNVNSVVREFLDLNREDAKYSAVVIQDRDGNRDRIVEQDYVTYTWHLGYVDRLTYDESNRDDIISTGINIINNIVNTIRNTWFPELEVSIVDRINTFDQRFTAQCAGVYVVLAVNAQVSDCIDSESTDLYDTYDAKITANGVYHFVPSGRPVDEINITVDVPGYTKEEIELNDRIMFNGLHTYTPPEDTVYGSVKINVDVAPEWGSIKGNISDQTDLVNYLGVMTSDIKSWVSGQGYLTEHQSLAGYATENWVESKGYLTEHQTLKTINGESIVGEGNIVINSPDLTGYATQSWVSSQGYLTEHQDLSSYALKSEIPSLEGYATQSWVEAQGYLTTTGLSGLATVSWVESNFLSSTALTGYATQSWVESKGYLTEHQSLVGYATESWVESKGYLTEHQDLSSYATQSWVSTNFLSNIPDTYATKSWVSEQGYLTEHQSLAGYATQSWVESKGYLTEHQSLVGYATESWVESKGYLTEHQDLSSYATKTDLNKKLDKSSIWTGNQTQWDSLSDTQKSSYIIALITE